MDNAAGASALEYVDTNDPRVKKAARELELTMIQRAYILDPGDGTTPTLYIITPYDHHEVPALAGTPPAGFGKTDTLPKGEGSPSPSLPSDSLGACSPRGEELAGGGLDDFTAIGGVGPVTAQTLHDHGFYTYDDLREGIDAVIPSHTATKIRRWLDQRLA